jgi:hypothetical protein
MTRLQITLIGNGLKASALDAGSDHGQITDFGRRMAVRRPI